MRIFTLLLASAVSFPAFGDEILATNKITGVTLYPQGAMIYREVAFDAAPGAHQLLLTDMPAETYAETIRVAGDAQVKPGAVWLREDRLFPRPDVLTPEQETAKAAVEAAQRAVDGAADAVASVQARIEAADAEVAFLAGNRPEGAGLTPEGLTALSGAVAQGIVAARGRAIAAGAEARPLQLALAKAETARDLAQQAFDALPAGQTDYAALSIAVDVAGAGPHVVTMSQYVDAAGWAPVYDATLERAAPARLTLARGAMVSQYTGEDWVGVTLTLSTARPSQQTDAGVLYPDYREIYDPQAEAESRAKAGAEAAMGDALIVTEAAPVTVGMPELQGDVLVYAYPGVADVASGVENLRLNLDEVTFAPKVQARAVPRLDSVAYMTAEFENTSAEILLPGQMFLYRDSNLVGVGQLPLLAAGDDWTLGFGAIDGLVLERRMPEMSEGDRGLLSSETEQVQRATLSVKNLTGEAWAVRMLDQVPYSEQDDLEVTFTASPPPTETDVDGQRGILAWEFDLGPGAEQKIDIEHALRWPSGMALR